ncbi:MAG: hypothetical protein OEZ13_13245 [Spirochaetia bacterium]|nr:hypothetical protein [Spirochaetia bacterium]
MANNKLKTSTSKTKKSVINKKTSTQKASRAKKEPTTKKKVVVKKKVAAKKKPVRKVTAKKTAKKITTRKAKVKKINISLTVAVIALILNLLFFPGVGSLLGGKVKAGIIQIFLFFICFILIFTIIGAVIAYPFMFCIWVWGIVISVGFIKNAQT